MIRTLEKDDYLLIKDLTKELSEESIYSKLFKGYSLTEDLFKEYLRDPKEKLCVLSVYEDKVVGFGVFEKTPWLNNDAPISIARLAYIYVQPEYRGKGLGKEIHEAFEYWGKMVGAQWYCKGNSGKNEGYIKFEVIYMKEVE